VCCVFSACGVFEKDGQGNIIHRYRDVRYVLYPIQTEVYEYEDEVACI
jgi:hypothetical protein